MDYKLLYTRKLPHYQPRHGAIFITFRIDFPIDRKHLHAFQQLKQGLQAQYGNEEISPDNKAIINKKLFAFTDEVYHQIDCGLSITGLPELARLVWDRILSLQGDHYHLYAFTLMPNHVHLLIRLLEQDGQPVQIGRVMNLLKGSTARAANQLLQRSGRFWGREYFDHWVRDQKEFANVIRYIRDNPLKAGLVKDASLWPWTWINPDLWQD